MVDFLVAPFTFAATEVTVVAKSDAAKALLAEKFGECCVSINVVKSQLPATLSKIEALGLSVI